MECYLCQTEVDTRDPETFLGAYTMMSQGAEIVMALHKNCVLWNSEVVVQGNKVPRNLKRVIARRNKRCSWCNKAGGTGALAVIVIGAHD